MKYLDFFSGKKLDVFTPVLYSLTCQQAGIRLTNFSSPPGGGLKNLSLID